MENDTERFCRELARRRRRDELALQQARQDSNQEPFDLERFEQLFDTTPDYGSLPSESKRRRVWESKYYLQYPDCRTVEEFASLMKSMDPYR